MRINDIWKDLEDDKSFLAGLLLRRYSPVILPDVFVAIRQPEGLRCIALRIRRDIKVSISRYSNLKDICLDLVPDENDNSKNLLLIILLNGQHKEVFSTLCEDLISQISLIAEQDRLLKEILNRFEKWKSLFEKAALVGLSQEEQRGLYGELFFLRKWIKNSSDLQQCIQCWLGPEKELRDFQSGGWAIEVKTTAGHNHQKVQISSERQLDITHLEALFIFHLSIEVQHQHGENLNQIVKSIIDLLSEDILAQVQFGAKILHAGYFHEHSVKYDNAGYNIRQESFYSVRDNFPRIEESDIRGGVGDVKYSIVLTDFSDYIVPESFALETIK